MIRREDKPLIDFLSNSAAMQDYTEGMKLLKRSGLIDMLTWLGMPKMVSGGSDVNIMAAQAAWSNGFQSCLEHIKDMRGIYDHLLNPPNIEGLEADYGGVKAAMKQYGYEEV